MPARLVDDDGETLFEFDNDALACALLLRLIGQAKHGEDLRPEITLNAHINGLARAVIGFAERCGVRGYAGANGHYPSPPAGVTWSPPPSWAHEVTKLLFDQAPALQWWSLDDARKREIVAEAFYPHRLSEETLADYTETIDFRVQRYRTDT